MTHSTGRDRYEPQHLPKDDHAGPHTRINSYEPPSWRLSGPLLVSAVVLMLITAGWLAYHYAHLRLR